MQQAALLNEMIAAFDIDQAGAELYRIVDDLFPICRSISGRGVRATLNYLKGVIPLEIREVPSGARVFDWTVPKEWNISDAYIKNSTGRKIVDFRDSNLHVVSYSTPLHAKLTLKELTPHVFTLPDHPDWIPYRTSYYNQYWGFCLKHRQLMELKEDEYEVVIDSSLEDGYLTYGEHFVQGHVSDEVLISTHICHPSLANDNLSGISICSCLARILSRMTPRYSYRFLFIPGTIGSITWLARNEEHTGRIKHGLVAACLGDNGGFTYKRTRSGCAEIDKSVEHVLRHSGAAFRIVDFSPYGYDERQYGSPGFNLPIGCLMRSPNGQYPEYHTSADDLTFVSPKKLGESLLVYLKIISVLEGNRKYMNLYPKCEPQLGRRGLYDIIGGRQDGREFQMALLWVLNFSDGRHALFDIAERAGIAFDLVRQAAEVLASKGLIAEAQI
jgi:aminopeptidase-like protein